MTENPQPLKFSFNLTCREFVGASFLVSYQYLITRLATLFLWVVGIAFIFLMLKSSKSIDVNNYLFLMLLFGFFPLMVLVVAIWQFKEIKKGSIHYILTDTALITKQNTISSEIGWDNIIKLAKIDKVLVFYYHKKQAFILPLRVISPTQKQQIIEFFKTKNIPIEF